MYLMDALSAWSRALRDPSLRDLPCKIETNEYGELVMSPQKPLHGRLQLRIGTLLESLADMPGHGAVEFAIETSGGIKVPDVAWMSEALWQRLPKGADASAFAPELCVEVLSESNTRAEIDEKRQLYFACGAVEVWTCDLEGRVRFFMQAGEQPKSDLVPSFPVQIEV